MSEPRTIDLVVIGGGAVGVTSALELARRGHKPVVLERSSDLVAGCSAGSAGLLSPAHSVPLATPAALLEGLWSLGRRDSPFSIDARPELVPWVTRFVLSCTPSRVERGARLIRTLSLASLDMHAALAAQGLDTGFMQRGALNTYATAAAFARGQDEAHMHAKVGIPSNVLDIAAAREFEPALCAELAGAIYYPREAHCEPRRYMEAVAAAAREHGTTIETGVEVGRLRHDGQRIAALETSAGPIRPGVVVIAAGAWTRSLSSELPVKVPLEGGKGYHLDLTRSALDPAVPIYMQEARVVATPMSGTLRLAGVLQLSGLDMRIAPARMEAVLKSGIRTLRGIDEGRVLERWRGIRPCTPDGLPIIGRSGKVDNLLFATGHAMKGLHLAPVTARLVADMVDGVQPEWDVGALRPDRFRATPGTRVAARRA